MKIKLKEKTDEARLLNRHCRFGIKNELEFSDLFGMDTTFVGTLKKIGNNNEYQFFVDRIQRGRTQVLHALDARKKADLRYMKLALENDYGLASDGYEIL